MNVLSAFDADMLCVLFAKSSLFVALCTSKALAALLAPLIDEIRTQQALTLEMKPDLTGLIAAIAYKTGKFRNGDSRAFEGVCHQMLFSVLELGRRYDDPARIEVHVSRPFRKVSLHVNVQGRLPQFAGVAHIRITPITAHTGELAVEFNWYCKNKSDVTVGYHRGYAAALRVFGLFV